MFFLFFQLCALIAIPLVLSLNIRLDNTPIGFHNTSVSLLWAQNDPSDFVLGAFLIHTKESVMVAKTMQPVEIFATNRTAYMVFNYTSLPGNRDCILLAWLPDSNISTTSSVSGTAPLGLGATPTPPIVVNSTPSPELTTPKSTTPSSPISSVSGTASSTSLNPASHTGIIVGVVFGVLAFGCAVSTSIYVLILRRRLKAAAPLLLPQDSPASTPISLNPSRMRVVQEREIEAQEPMLEIPRDRLEAEIARMREEIMALRLENQIRRMEAGYSSLSPPSYSKNMEPPKVYLCNIYSTGVVPTHRAKSLAFQSTSISLSWEHYCNGCGFGTDQCVVQNAEKSILAVARKT
ncbi:hypothetical protein EV421DRAFT_1740578 [Armillaria borealis]|uniref:Fibronectin type-III domain-containing protein n=1 Tax=Armillaria borealis TaxID=47425 RepID=A0AA39MHW3_9AGAR|nr:hypothetical protein EV421DRAFT_1740578 [Armillaria borealis]